MLLGLWMGCLFVVGIGGLLVLLMGSEVHLG